MASKKSRKIRKVPRSTTTGGEALAGLRRSLADVGAPPEVLRMLEEPGDPLEILDRLMGSGLVPSPPQQVTSLFDQWQPLLEPGRTQLDAELSGAEFLSLVRQAAPHEEALPELLTEMISDGEQTGRPEALAMARVLAVVGPEQVRPAATAAAERLVRTGLSDPPWVSGLGAPKVGRCFGYADFFGSQETLALTFSYGRQRHAIAVLIDHDLGGGIKDCWATDKPADIRAGYLAATRQIGLELTDYEPAEARAILDLALSKPPCPVAPDQIASVGTVLDILRSRVALLPTPAESTPATSTASPATPTESTPAAPTATTPARPTPKPRQAPKSTGTTVHRLKITLRGSRPPIWRRLEVSSSITLSRLHEVIQAAFGWHNCHLWVFETPAGQFGVSDPELGHQSASAKKLAAVAPRTGDRLRYTYDFGDDWEHDILIEDVLAEEPEATYPRCLAGRRAGPPEDCGGVWGYQSLLAVLADPEDSEHQDTLDWLGLETAKDFDPAAFDQAATTAALSCLTARRQ